MDRPSKVATADRDGEAYERAQNYRSPYVTPAHGGAETGHHRSSPGVNHSPPDVRLSRGCMAGQLREWNFNKSKAFSSVKMCPKLALSENLESIMRMRTVTLAAALVAASIPSLSTTAQARPFGFHGGFGHYGGGGWGWGGVGFGLAAGALIAGALSTPAYGYGCPYGGYGYGYNCGYGYSYAPAYSYGYGAPYWGYSRPYRYSLGYGGYRAGYGGGGYRVGYGGYRGGYRGYTRAGFGRVGRRF